MKTVPTFSMRRFALVFLALLVIPTLIGGCGGVAALVTGGGGGGNDSVDALGLGPTNFDLLTNLLPTLNENWQSNPVVAPVTLSGTNYADGLKGAVFADVVSTGVSRYHLGGQYSALGLAFGVCADEPDSPSWTAFRFWGDGRELAVPHYVKRGERREIFVDVRGVQNLDLIAEGIPQTDGISYVSTRVGWGDATLIKEAGIKYLVDFTPTATSGWSTPPTEGTIWVNWRPYPHSVVGIIHKGQPASSVTYNLAGAYKSFATIAGISQNETDSGATVSFQVLADGVSRHLAISGKQAQQLIQFDVTGVNTLEVRTQVATATEDDIDVGWGMALVAEN